MKDADKSQGKSNVVQYRKVGKGRQKPAETDRQTGRYGRANWKGIIDENEKSREYIY